MIVLIDADESTSTSPPEEILVHKTSLVFPVYSSGSNPRCYQDWKKQRSRKTLGMPLWTAEELQAECDGTHSSSSLVSDSYS